MKSTIDREMISENMMDGYEKLDVYNEDTIRKLSGNYLDILKLVGENPERDGLLKTPERVAKAMLFLTHGYDLDP
ncbi:MAG TPA: GTP cyclohydrolase I, partial [Bacteroidales bacterium]|nr:GTP cyclohydrolase I [Bacteroidales bacterium]